MNIVDPVAALASMEVLGHQKGARTGVEICSGWVAVKQS